MLTKPSRRGIGGRSRAGRAPASSSFPPLVFAWGDVGHRITGEAAALALPPSTPAFFRNASRQLAYLNPEPDRWRERAESAIDPALDRATAPEHFIDMEMVPPRVLAGGAQGDAIGSRISTPSPRPERKGRRWDCCRSRCSR